MTDDTILLIGLDNTKVNTDRVYETDRYTQLLDVYGEDTIFAEPFRILQDQFDAQHILVMNLDSWDDIRNSDEIFRQYDFSYIVPLGLRLTDSYDNVFEDKRYYYVQYLVWMTEYAASTVIVTGLHSSNFNTLTEYLIYEHRQIDTVAPYLMNLRRNNLIYVSNGLKKYKDANVVLAGMLLNDISEYPLQDFIGEAYWDMDYSDVDFNLVWFRNNYLRPTTVENLKNFADVSIIKSVLVDRIIKYLRKHFTEIDDYIGTAFSTYKMMKIAERTEAYLQSLVGWIIYDYEIISVYSEQHSDSTMGIHVRFSISPRFTTEKFTDEVIL